MAVTVLAPISAIGRRVLALFRSVFVLVLDAFRRASRRVLHSFSLSAHNYPTPKTLPEQTDPLCSATTTPSSSSRPAHDSNHLDSDLEGNESPGCSDANMSPSSSSPAAPPPQQPPRKLPVPNIIPALPRLPLQPKRETKQNACPKPPAPGSSAQPANRTTTGLITENSGPAVSVVSNGINKMRIDDSGVPEMPALMSQPKPVAKEVSLPDKEKEMSRLEVRPRSSRNFGLDPDGNPTREVLRYPAVPLSHDVSQTSKLKESNAFMTGLDDTQLSAQTQNETPEEAAERAIHSGFMREALDMVSSNYLAIWLLSFCYACDQGLIQAIWVATDASLISPYPSRLKVARLALKTNETPVGCVIVHNNRVIARGMNATNVSRNGTRHAELMAICALLSYAPSSDIESPKKKRQSVPKNMPLGDKTNQARSSSPDVETSSWGDVDPTDGHLFPYGQKLHPSPRVDRAVISECVLYVTVEPCVMCASLLRQLRIRKVYFGAVNDKFGGTGGVFRIHMNSPRSLASAPPSPAPQNNRGLVRPTLERRPASASTLEDGQPSQTEERTDNGVSAPVEAPLPGDGGNVERGYEVEGGWGRDEAVTLLRQFYVQENGRAPVPRKKEGRAARLAAMMERDGHAGGPLVEGIPTANGQENVAPETAPEKPESEAVTTENTEP
ncbi:putative tRNA-specific adenosine deaminase [Echria macrotheca]|uniref:tRNA-specific adenosine deaminase n=1 Tax=Echria macrotheca TaxID=438768 RepID=A0AAJ0BHD7_9PEZI|nr:putative tRNA-specific adenosine deaminase [Echria macrotheca]